MLGPIQEIEPFLNERIIGQPEAARAIATVVKRSFPTPDKPSLAKRDRPYGVFMFLGPTGTGKTEITLAATEYLFGDPAKPEDRAWRNRLFRFDMAEYTLANSVDRMLGDSPLRQGLLGDALDAGNKQGGGVILFDEIEKAHPQVRKVFLGLTDAARITMTNGSTKNAELFYLVCTSNLGSAQAIQMETAPYSTMERHILMTAQKELSPEVFARMGEKVVFNKLSYSNQLIIARNMLTAELARLGKIVRRQIHAAHAVFNFIVKIGYTKTLGARPMRDAVERHVGNALTEWILRNPGWDAGQPIPLLLVPSSESLLVREFASGRDDSLLTA